MDIYKGPPYPAGTMCKPCPGDPIVVTDNIDEKDPALIKRLRIFANEPGQFELKKKYLFTVKVRGKLLNRRPIHDVNLISFTEMAGSSNRVH